MKTQVAVRVLTWAAVMLVKGATARHQPLPQLPDVIIGDPNDPGNDILGSPLSGKELIPRRSDAGEASESEGDPASRSGFFQGDIMLSSKDHLLQVLQGSTNSQRSAASNPALRWPNGVIPYVISSSFSQSERAVIGGAMGEYHSKTCLRFVPRQRHHSSYVHILRGQGCSSAVGRSGGLQVISLGQGCVQHGVVVHELMHAAGFWHEQSRYDRDQHVIIIWQNIVPNMRFNFDKKTNRVTSDLGLEYDYGSVMHYGPRDFAQDPSRPTIIPRVSGVTIGQRRGFSRLDIKGLNLLYRCGTSGPPPSVTLEGCKDTHESCWNWAAKGVCRTSAAFMSRACRKSCGFCHKVECIDKNTYCAWWAGQGECQRNPSYMTDSCRKSCKTCGVQAAPCKDQHNECKRWAASGECDRKPSFVPRRCPLSCRVCGRPPRAPFTKIKTSE